MGGNLSKYGNGQTTNFSLELNINVNDIKTCEHFKLQNGEHNVYPLLVDDVKEAINKMNICYYEHSSYVYDVSNNLKITFNDDKELVLGLTDCGRVGIPKNSWGIWFYLINSDNKDDKYTNSFRELLNAKS